MPIDIEEFEEKHEAVLEFAEGTQPYRVLNFLADNKEKAFSASEIAESTNIKEGSIGAVLKRLEEKGLVRHKSSYWAIAEDDRIASTTAMTEASSESVE